MLFSSITFLYCFLPAVLLCYFLAPKGARNAVLLVFSLIFYFFGEPVYTLLLLFSSLSDYAHSLVIERRRGMATAKIALVSSIVVNLAMLGFFKYADFFVHTVNALFGLSLPLPGVPLPIGISFFTFQTMSYTIDVYRGRVHAERNLLSLATFVCLFPQLIAGPIVRYTDVATELNGRSTGREDFYLGARRFVWGLGKKVLIANAMGELCTSFRSSGEETVLFFWLYAVGFTLEIYFDFSGYSDMAIGLGRIFGFRFPENFDYPYLSRSITEFWRRWHMTLGGWFRDYVYIPLGGNRVSRAKWFRNIFIVWGLTGLWHGAAWNFAVWGLLFGALLVAEKLWLLSWLKKKAGRVLPHLYVLFVVVLSFVIFNGDGMAGAARDLMGMFGLLGVPLGGTMSLYTLRSYGLLLALSCVGATPYPKRIAERVGDTDVGRRLYTVLEPLALAVLLLVSTASLVDGSFNPFLYFRF